MRAPTSFLSLVSLIALPALTLSCGFPNDWKFDSTGGGSSGSSGTSGSSGSAGTGGSTAGTGGTSMTTSTGGTGTMMCPAGTGDCDKNPGNGCEASLTTETDCGACGVPCALSNVATPCATGKCEIGTCITPWDNCDGVVANGCEANLLTDSGNCGMCGKSCMGASPSCVNGTCKAGCSPDGFEPNEQEQAPAPLPILAGMKVFDSANNNFKTSEARTTAIMPTFTTEQDVDVFYLQVTDDVPLPAGKTAKGALFDITVSSIPAGATFSVDTYYTCTDPNFMSITEFGPMMGNPCPPNAPNTGFIGPWYHCQNDAPATLKTISYGIGCDDGSKDANGYLQIKVSVKTPPGAMTCDPYTLTVKVSAVSAM